VWMVAKQEVGYIEKMN
jgi:hypothetical protein